MSAIKNQEKPMRPYKALKQKQKARIADWMFEATRTFYLKNQRMPTELEAEQVFQTIYPKINSVANRVARDEILALYKKRLAQYEVGIQKLREAGSLEPVLEKKKGSSAPSVRRRKRKKKCKEESFECNEFQNDYFFFIAGYTSGGAPYGVTWEQMGLEPWEELDN